MIDKKADTPTISTDNASLQNELVNQARTHLASLHDLAQTFTAHPDNEHAGKLYQPLNALRGLAGFFECPKLETLSEAAEQLMDAARNQDIAIDGTLVKIMQTTGATLDEMVAYLEAHGNEASNLGDAITAEIRAIQTDKSEPISTEEISTTSGESNQCEAVAQENPKQLEASELAQPPSEDCSNTLINDALLPTQSQQVGDRTTISDSQLDELLDLSRQLVETRNHLQHYTHKRKDQRFAALYQSLDNITQQFQHKISTIRQQPFVSLWARVLTQAQDRARSHDLNLETSITDPHAVAIDQSWTNALKQPLQHCLQCIIDLHKHNLTCSEDTNLDHATVKLHADVDLKAHRLSIELHIADPLNEITLAAIEGAFSDINARIAFRLAHTNNTLLIDLPVITPVIDAMLVEVQPFTFAIPSEQIQQVLTVPTNTIEHIYDAMIYRLDDNLLPIIPLTQLLEQKIEAPTTSDSTTTSNHTQTTIMVLAVDQLVFGLIVDNLGQQQQISVRSLPSKIKSIDAYIGATIIDDQTIVLILDPTIIAQKAKVYPQPHTSLIDSKDTADTYQAREHYES